MQFDIKFSDLSYCVGEWHNGQKSEKERKLIIIARQEKTTSYLNNDSHLLAVKKQILKNINGEFRGCELTGIVGQSGSGKTSLLSILSGYTKNDVSGSIWIDGDESIQQRRKRLKYIMQDYTLHHFITVREAMSFSANFKLNGVCDTIKKHKVSRSEGNFLISIA
jgi:ABC-type multidrug transport system ATPase subunit